MARAAATAGVAFTTMRSHRHDRHSGDGLRSGSLRAPSPDRRSPRAPALVQKLSSIGGSLKAIGSRPDEWPKPEDTLLDTVYQKLCPGNVWRVRRILVTAHTMYIARETEVLETIPLSAVVKLSCPEFDLVRDTSTEHGHLKTYLHHMEETAAGEDLAGLHVFPFAHSAPGLPRSPGSPRSPGALFPGVTVPKIFSVLAHPEGLEAEKRYHFKSCDPHAPASDLISWVKELADIMKRDLDITIRRRKFERIQRASKDIFDLNITRWIFAALIFLSFLSDVAQAQLLPETGSQIASIFYTLELSFTIIFLVELMWNLFSNFLQPFLNDGWSLFDTVVVAVSLLSLSMSEGNGGIKSIRLVRVARALRLVARFQSLRKIVDALTQAIFPVLSACMVAIMAMSIFAILGVSFFGQIAPTYFGDFGLAMMTLFATATMENWVGVSVEVMGGDPASLNPGVMAYFISYIVLVGYVLTSVVVAVLLENFSAAQAREQESASDMSFEGEGVLALKVSSNSLDPLLQQLSMFENSQDLSNRIGLLFEALDTDESGTLSPEEIVIGLNKLDLTPRIKCSLDDFNYFTHDRAICLPDGTLGRVQFEAVLRTQLRDYISRSIAVTGTQQQNGSSNVMSVLLSGMNQVLIDLQSNSGNSNLYLPSRSSLPRSGSDRSLYRTTSFNGKEGMMQDTTTRQGHSLLPGGTQCRCGTEGALGVPGVTKEDSGLCTVPPPPVHVLEAIEEKASNIVVGVLKLQVLLEGLREGGRQVEGGEGKDEVAICAESALAQVREVITESKQLLSSSVTARQDLKREENSRTGSKAEMKSREVKIPDTKSTDSEATKEELQSDMSNILMVMEKQKQSMVSEFNAQISSQLASFVRERDNHSTPREDNGNNHVAQAESWEQEERKRGEMMETGESSVGRKAGQGEDSAREGRGDAWRPSLALSSTKVSFEQSPAPGAEDGAITSSTKPPSAALAPPATSRSTPHTDVGVTLDLDVRKEIFPDFLERLRTDLHVATGHQAGDFRIKTLLPDDTHSVIELRILPRDEGNRDDHAHLASPGHTEVTRAVLSPSQIADDLKQQLQDPQSKLCNGALTRHISSILIRSVYDLPQRHNAANSSGLRASPNVVSSHGQKWEGVSGGPKTPLGPSTTLFSTRSSSVGPA